MKIKPLLDLLKETERIPHLGFEKSRFSSNALHMIVAGDRVSVDTLKVMVEDINTETNQITIAFAFCDENDVPIVYVGRHTMRVGDVLTLGRGIANPLTFTVS